jgi:hypothetical protein
MADTRKKCRGGQLDGQMLATPADEARCVEGGGTVEELPTVGSTNCFIVTAATGSPQSAELAELRDLRQQVVHASSIAEEIIARVYRDYAEFAPAIAADLHGDGFARQVVLRTVVTPLVAWYRLAGKLALERSDTAGIATAIAAISRACPSYLQATGIVDVLTAIHTGEDLPFGAAAALGTFTGKLRRAVELPFASWAILQPLLRVWTIASDHRDPIREVAQWLEAVPLDDPQLFATRCDCELHALAALFDFVPEARHRLGARLLAAWPGSEPQLKRTGFAA